MSGAPKVLSARTRQACADVARWLVERHQRLGLRIAGINGAQGSGKSTLAAFLVEHLATEFGLRAEAVSLDDFYLGKAARIDLAARFHPLFITRGVPGTHDVARGLSCLRQLANLQAGDVCRIPRFSKADDDRLPAAQDRCVTAPPDLVLFEGWCVGTPAQQASALADPVNDLERTEDADGSWRRHVNAQLAGPYAEWFALLDAQLFLQVPGWPQVRQWRAQQERETAAQAGHSAFSAPADLERFLQHYQRLTEHAWNTLPKRADVVLELDPGHDVAQVRLARCG
jgi:D-glycerate 3-kinase